MISGEAKSLLHPTPILRPEKRPEISPHHQHIGVSGLQPVFQVIPLALFRKQNPAALPVAIDQGHIFDNDHTEYRLVFAFASAFVARVVEARAHHLDDFAVLPAVFFKNLYVAFFLSGFVVSGQPGADRGGRAGCRLPAAQGVQAKHRGKDQKLMKHVGLG